MDACYDRGSIFLLFFSANHGAPEPKFVENRYHIFFLQDSFVVYSGHGIVYPVVRVAVYFFSETKNCFWHGGLNILPKSGTCRKNVVRAPLS